MKEKMSSQSLTLLLKRREMQTFGFTLGYYCIVFVGLGFFVFFFFLGGGSGQIKRKTGHILKENQMGY
jgi:hypothetical protein